jgi:hypothetical protein
MSKLIFNKSKWTSSLMRAVVGFAPAGVRRATAASFR